ncbi:hypothetical protein WHR41_03651 [Cladosporium halotolerans]|uniref:Heme haloperoxidase family profile domain-containing protein n=1 Tax=Cladosporium halotolerans TaxID=1052096 RepID=A0AB34KRD2_9PEZI
MHFQRFLLAASCVAGSLAFPAHHLQEIEKRGLLSGLLDLTSGLLQTIEHDLEGVLEALDPFENKAVDVSGKHAFQPPTSEDLRGPCPGLNAMANHGYIHRSGHVGLIESVAAMHQVFNMGIELALVLAIMGVVWTGNPISLDPSFSIGGNSTAVWNALDNLQGVLGTPQGIDHSHNFLEADASPTRNDLYATGDAWTMNMTRFEQLYNTVPAEEDFSFDVLAKWSADRWHESVETNPYFYYGPFTGMIARNAGFFFIGRLMANHTSGDNTEGKLTHNVLQSFFGVYNTTDGGLEYRPGHEQIPENWYHTPVDYGLVQLNVDTLAMIAQYPELGSIGGNVGSVNSFTGVDLDDILGGVINAGQLLEGNNLLCFVMQVVKMASPNYLSNIYKTLEAPLDLIQQIVKIPLLSLDCPVWDDLTMGGEPLWDALQNKFPGAKKSSGCL